MMKKIAVVLSGCGVYDGSEIHEAVLTLYFLDRVGVRSQCFAPDIPQAHVINHLTGEKAEGETRNVLVEAARIARSNIQNLAELRAEDYHAVILPGGFGAAKNLSTFAFKGAECSVNPEVERVMKEFNAAGKPVGILCIAPVMGAKVLHAEVTIGEDQGVADAICHLGGSHVNKTVTEIHIDEAHNVVTTPAYMYDAHIADVAEGIEKLVLEIVERA